MISLPPLSDLLTLLRSQGVAAFRATNDSLHVEFAPTFGPAPTAGSNPSPEKELGDSGEVNAADLVLNPPSIDVRLDPTEAE